MRRKMIEGEQPEFEGALQGWAMNYVRTHGWRCEGVADFDDLMQDAYVWYLVVKDRYWYVTEPKHFMALFKRCFMNHITDLANERTSTIGLVRSQMTIGAADGLATELELVPLLANAPVRVRQTIAALCKDYRPKTKQKGVRQTTNECVCELLGVDPTKYNLIGLAKSYFTAC